MQNGRQDYSLMLIVLVLLALVVANVVSCKGHMDKVADAPRTYYSRYQSYDAAFKDYSACKAQAPKGFDCIMQPVLVSEQFIKEQYK